MRGRSNTSALAVFDFEASSLCVENVNVGALDHGAMA